MTTLNPNTISDLDENMLSTFIKTSCNNKTVYDTYGESNSMNQKPTGNSYQEQFTDPQYLSNNLNTLATLHLVYGILSSLGSLFFIIYILMGAVLSDQVIQDSPNPPPFDVRMVFTIIGSVGIFFCILKAVLNFLTSSYLRKAKNFNFIFATAVINCISGLLGIGLGVFTLVEIHKPHVKELFHRNRS